ncbi:hypothetical protein CRUP_003493 [Coryphaenoides rupestris]|nr:hypothetical protein CRUP_003493 [Coryphaenoides rupestris]
MGWYQQHRRAYAKALVAAHGPPGYGQQCPGKSSSSSSSSSSNHQHTTDWHGGGEDRGGRVRRGEKRSRESPKPLDSEEEESGSDEGDGYIECDVSNMEITEELRQYFAQTERHREELSKEAAGSWRRRSTASYVPADPGPPLGGTAGLAAAPHERPGRGAMPRCRNCTGDDAAKIQAMEAALQLTFDRNCDRKQPKYWPVIPLRL